MEEGEVVCRFFLPADEHATKAVHPTVRAFHHGDISPNRRKFRQGQSSLENDWNSFFPRQFEEMSIPLKPLLLPPFAHQSLFLAGGKP